MGIAWFTTASLLAPIQKLLRNGVAGLYANSFSRQDRVGERSQPHRAWPTQSLPQGALRAMPHRPLRVVRVLDGVQGSRGFGRMVISGRMADVCAELDRMAACEAPGI